MARFVQIGDLHLGKTLYGVRLDEDQKHLLDQVLEVLKTKQPDALLITGDVYETQSPPEYAIQTFDEFLRQACTELGVRTIVIPGNHDSAVRIAFGAHIFGDQLHIEGRYNGGIKPITIQDKFGPIAVYPVPFVTPNMVRSIEPDAEVCDQQTTMAHIVSAIEQSFTTDRNILMAHTFVSGGKHSDSEEDIGPVGGINSVSPKTFDAFDYVAVGHLHRPQSFGNERIQYAGSLMKYSLSEVGRDKSITVVDMDQKGALSVERIKLQPQRDLRLVRGSLAELLETQPHPATHDFVAVELLDKEPVLHAADRLRPVYPNLLNISRSPIVHEHTIQLPGDNHSATSPSELFQTFYQQVMGEQLKTEQLKLFEQILDEMERTS
jgi:exonuclease SbcD